MKLWTRLQRVERKAKFQSDADVPDDGQDAPGPQGIDPASWASRIRVARCGEARLAGVLRADEYLPDMDEAERRAPWTTWPWYSPSWPTGVRMGPSVAGGGARS